MQATATLDKWPLAVIQNLWTYFDSAISAIENDSSISAERKEVLKERIDYDSVSVRYFELKLHSNNFSKAELAKKIDDFEAICRRGNLGGLRSWTTIYEEILTWRELL